MCFEIRWSDLLDCTVKPLVSVLTYVQIDYSCLLSMSSQVCLLDFWLTCLATFSGRFIPRIKHRHLYCHLNLSLTDLSGLILYDEITPNSQFWESAALMLPTSILIFVMLPLILWKNLPAHCLDPCPILSPIVLSWGSTQENARSSSLELPKDLGMGVVALVSKLYMCYRLSSTMFNLL